MIFSKPLASLVILLFSHSCIPKHQPNLQLHAARSKQQEFETDNKKLQGWLEISTRTLKNLRGKNRESEKMIQDHEKEIKAITGVPEETVEEVAEAEEEAEAEAEAEEEVANGEAEEEVDEY